MSNKVKRTKRKIKRREMREYILHRLRDVCPPDSSYLIVNFAIRAAYYNCYRIDWDAKPKPRLILGKLLGRPVETIPFLRDALLANADRLIANRERGLKYTTRRLGVAS